LYAFRDISGREYVTSYRMIGTLQNGFICSSGDTLSKKYIPIKKSPSELQKHLKKSKKILFSAILFRFVAFHIF